MGRIAAAAGAAVAIMLAVAPGASAAVNCQYNASLHRVSLSATTGPTSLAVRRSGTKIQWRGGNGAYVDCGTATVTNTDDIQYVETAGPGGTTTTFEIDLSGGPFAPGFTSEGVPGSSEIEFHTLFGSGDGDVLKITSPVAALHVRFGAQGANLNSSERIGVDQDLTIGNEPPDFYVLTGSPEVDEVSGAGGQGTGYLPTSIPMIVNPAAGADSVTGGSGADQIDVFDSAAGDNVLCSAGADSVHADPGDTVAADCESVDRGPAPGGPGGGGGAGGPGADTTAPVFASASLLRTRFAVGPRATPVSARAKRGSAFRWSLSEAATVKIAITRRARGVRKRGKCVKPRRGLRGKRCRRTVRAGTLTRHPGAGASNIAFSGRIGRRALKPARYTATLVATDAAGNTSQPARLKFRVVRR